MKAMILAAGRGSRMEALTDNCPKPLLEVGAYSLIEHQLRRLKSAGINDVIINISYLGSMIQKALGNGKNYAMNIEYSEESEPLETGGGIYQALPRLGDEFLVINSDVWCDHSLSSIPSAHCLAHLVLIDNPEHNARGDFNLCDGIINNDHDTMLTFSGIGWYKKQLFENCSAGKFPLAPVIREAIPDNTIHGEHYLGEWVDVGTPERLQNVRQTLTKLK